MLKMTLSYVSIVYIARYLDISGQQVVNHNQPDSGQYVCLKRQHLSKNGLRTSDPTNMTGFLSNDIEKQSWIMARFCAGCNIVVHFLELKCVAFNRVILRGSKSLDAAGNHNSIELFQNFHNKFNKMVKLAHSHHSSNLSNSSADIRRFINQILDGSFTYLCSIHQDKDTSPQPGNLQGVYFCRIQEVIPKI